MVHKELPFALNKLNPKGIHDSFPNGKQIWPNKFMIQGSYLAVKKFRNLELYHLEIFFGELN